MPARSAEVAQLQNDFLSKRYCRFPGLSLTR